MTIENLPQEYQALWEACLPLLEQGRSGDVEHAEEVVNYVLQYQKKMEFDPEVLIPAAMLHDIGHAAILPEHFKYVTGQNKLANGKLVHMLAGAKIAKDILTAVDYDPVKTQKIVDIVATHDADQLKLEDWRAWYDTVEKKVFHDIDALDRYNEQRVKHFVDTGMYDKDKMTAELTRLLDNFFYPEFKQIAEENLKKLS